MGRARELSELATGYDSGGLFGFRNRIINGAMVIDQRNAGASKTITDTGANTYTLDRWFAYGNNASKFSVQQNAGSVTPPAGFTNYLGVTSLAATTVAAGDQYIIGQPIEGFNVADFSWGTANAQAATLSFRVYSSLTGTFGGALRNSAGTRSYPFTYSVASANTWTTATVTVPGDTSGTWVTNNGVGLYVYLGLGVGSTYLGTAGAWAGALYTSATGSTNVVATNGATFYITGVQLEKGSTATSFDYRDYGREFAMCQRYLCGVDARGYSGTYASFGFINANSTSSGFGIIQFPVSMRVPPTSVITSAANTFYADPAGVTNFTGIAINSISQTSGVVILTGGSGLTNGSTGRFLQNNTSAAYILFSSEL